MKNKTKLTLRILAAILAFTLIGGIFYVTNSIMGNPISRILADKTIREYVEQNYSFLDLEVEKPIYNFKTGSYMARAKSKTSIDTHFAIYAKNGKVTNDHYEINVLGMFNTRERLAQEYSLLARKIISQELGYKDNTTYVIYKNDEKSNEILQLDMKFDHKLPLNAEVNLRLELEDTSLENLANVLLNAHQAFLKNDCYFYRYNIYSEGDESNISVFGVTPEDIESGQLANLLEEEENYEEKEPITTDEGERKKEVEQRIFIYRKS